MSTVPAGHKIITRTAAITANYKKTDPQKAIGDPEGIFIKKDTGRTVFGVGTKTPFSRISMGDIDHSLADSGDPILAFTEDQSGNYASGISFHKTTNSQKLSLRFSINPLRSSTKDGEQDTTNLDRKISSVTDAPILSLRKTIETITNEELDSGQTANTGNKVFINCIQPIRGGFSQRSGLEVNGMISLTDRLNFYKTSIFEALSVNNEQGAMSLYHEQADGNLKELLHREGQNRVVDASSALISVLPDSLTNGPNTNSSDPKGIFLFKNCDFAIGNGEMATAGQVPPNSSFESVAYWARFQNISTSFLNLRGNTVFAHVNDISSALLPIVSQAYENIDYSRNGVLYLQNNLGIGSYQPRAIIDCSKVDLPFLMMGRDINDISNNTVAFGDDLNIPLANYSFIFGEEHDLSGGPGDFNSTYNFIFGKENTVRTGATRLNDNFIYGKRHIFQGDNNFLFGNDHNLTVDVSYCTLLGHGGKIDSLDVDSAIMKYTLGKKTDGGIGDIFVLTRDGSIIIPKDISCNTIYAINIGKEGEEIKNAYFKDISAANIGLTEDLICGDLVCNNLTTVIQGTVPVFKVTTRLEVKDTYTDDNYFLKGKKILHTTSNTLNIDSSSNIIFNTNKIFINSQGDFSIGADNSTTTGTLYAKANNSTITGTVLSEGLQFGKDTNSDYYLRLASNSTEKTNIEFGIIGAASINKIVYDGNENSLNTYYDGSYNIYNGSTKKISITNAGAVEITAPLLFNSQNQFFLNSSILNISVPTNIFDNVSITGTLNVNGIDVGEASRAGAGASKWKATGANLYVKDKIAINIEEGNFDNSKNPFNQYFPKFDLDISGNLRAFNLLLGRPVLNMMPFSMTDFSANILNKTYANGYYDICYNLHSDNSVVYRLFDNDPATYWDSSNAFIGVEWDGNAPHLGGNISNPTRVKTDNNYTLDSEIMVAGLSGEKVDIALPQLWTLKYYGFKPPPISADLSKNMPSKWYIIAKSGYGNNWKLIDEKDISNNEEDYFQEDKYYYFNVDPSNNFSRDHYTDFSFIFNRIFNTTTGTDNSCNIGGIQLFGELTGIPDFSSNIIQTDLQNNTVDYDDISHVNQNQTKHLSLQPFGGRVGIYNINPKVILDISADDAVRLPVGNNNFKSTGTASDFQGCIRFNTQDNQFEGCDGANWGGLGGVISLDQQTKITATDASGLKFINDGKENVIIDESGNVGIGTMLPKMILDISASDAIKLPTGITSERPKENYGVSLPLKDFLVTVSKITDNDYYYISGDQAGNKQYTTGSGKNGLRFYMDSYSYEDYPLKIATTKYGGLQVIISTVVVAGTNGDNTTITITHDKFARPLVVDESIFISNFSGVEVAAMNQEFFVKTITSDTITVLKLRWPTQNKPANGSYSSGGVATCGGGGTEINVDTSGIYQYNITHENDGKTYVQVIFDLKPEIVASNALITDKTYKINENVWILTIQSANITASKGVMVQQLNIIGKLHTALTGFGMTSIVISVSTDDPFNDTTPINIGGTDYTLNITSTNKYPNWSGNVGADNNNIGTIFTATGTNANDNDNYGTALNCLDFYAYSSDPAHQITLLPDEVPPKVNKITIVPNEFGLIDDYIKYSGSIRFNKDNHLFEGFDGVKWKGFNKYITEDSDITCGRILLSKHSNRNTVLGFEALMRNGGDSNTAMGKGCLKESTGNYNTAIGEGTLHKNRSGPNNTAIGVGALFHNQNKQDDHTINQDGAGKTSTGKDIGDIIYDYSGNGNTGVGYNALTSNKIGDFNTAIGYQAGDNFDWVQDPGGNPWTVPRLQNGKDELNKTTCLGYKSLADISNVVILGDPTDTNNNVGIGTKAPSTKLEVVGDISSNGVLDISSIVVNRGGAADGGIVDLSKASFVYAPLRAVDDGTDSTNENNVATTWFVTRAINNLIGGAPATLDTLKEISDFLQGGEGTDLLDLLAAKQDTLSSTNKLDAAFIGTSGSVTNAMFDYLEGVSSAIQTQLDAKQTQLDAKQPTITGAATTIDTENLTVSKALISNASGKVAVHSTVTDTQLGYLDGVSSAIQTQLDGKQITITGAATTIDTENLTVSKALISNASGKVAVHSTVTDTQLGYLDGVSSAIQTQLDAKQATLTAGTNITITIDGGTYTISATGGGGGGGGSGIFTVSGNNAYYNTGNIGIGTSTPTHTLDVVGEIHATGNIVSFTSSDRKLKNNLVPIEEPLEKLKKINGYTFEWVKNKDVHSFEGKDIGVIAQEVEEVLPEVTITREDGYKAVRYEKMVPFLISCIKAQQTQIDELRELLKK